MTNDYGGDDIYCDLILSGLLPVEIVMETDKVLAFHHTRPFWPTHIVVIPKQHVLSLIEIEADSPLLPDLMRVIQRVSRVVLDQTGAVAIQTHVGTYQDSKHLHWHIRSGEF